MNHPVFEKFVWKASAFNDKLKTNGIGAIQRKCYDSGMHLDKSALSIYKALSARRLDLAPLGWPRLPTL